MKWQAWITIAISALGLLAAAMSGVIWLVNESAKYQDQERRETESRVDKRIDRAIDYTHERIDRTEKRNDRLVDEVLNNRERILRLENPKQEIAR